MSDGGWIGVDLDGTLAEYHGWQGIEHIGPPIAPMVERVKRWLNAGQDVRIFTARVSPLFIDPNSDPATNIQIVGAIQRWSAEHLGRTLPITCVKDFGLIELWDDRAVQVAQNKGEPVGYSTRGLE